MFPSPGPQFRDPTYHSTEANYNLPNEYLFPPVLPLLNSHPSTASFFPLQKQHVDANPPLPALSNYELTRLEDQAVALSELMHNVPIHAPLHKPNLLIDIGCGTGIQTCALGTTYPAARIYGIDLSPVPPRDGGCPKPSSVEYIQGDIRALVERDTRLRAGEVDYAFSRLLIHGITDWQGYVSDVARLLRPGGWAEMHEYVQDWYVDGELVSGQWPWLSAIRQQAESNGGDYRCGWNIKGYMQKVGLVDVRQVEYRVPYGTWMVREKPETGRIGRHTAREYGMLYHHGIERILEGAGYEQRQIEEFQAQAKRNLGAEQGKDVPFVVTIGRKPEKWILMD